MKQKKKKKRKRARVVSGWERRLKMTAHRLSPDCRHHRKLPADWKLGNLRIPRFTWSLDDYREDAGTCRDALFSLDATLPYQCLNPLFHALGVLQSEILGSDMSNLHLVFQAFRLTPLENGSCSFIPHQPMANESLSKLHPADSLFRR